MMKNQQNTKKHRTLHPAWWWRRLWLIPFDWRGCWGGADRKHGHALRKPSEQYELRKDKIQFISVEKTPKTSLFWGLLNNYLENGSDSCFTNDIFGCPSPRYIIVHEVARLHNKYLTMEIMNEPFQFDKNTYLAFFSLAIGPIATP